MRLKIIFAGTILALFLISCEKSLDEGFENANKNVKKKYVKQLHVTYPNEPKYNKSYVINYGGENRITSVTDGEESHFFNYGTDGDLLSITGGEESFEMSHFYQAPYDVFEEGNVLEYDDKGNPKKIEVFLGSNNTSVAIGEILYDPNPNPFYYTLKAAGIIGVIDQVDLNIGTPTSPSIVKAKKMLPFNHYRSMIFFSSAGQIVMDIQFDTIYDEEGYVKQTTITSIGQEETQIYQLKYVYQ